MLAALMGVAAWAEPGLPLESESFTIDVTGNLAEIVMKQRFRNPSTGFVNATYEFPLDNDAVVDSMVLTVGDRVVRSVIEGKEEARIAWQEAAANGQIAALTEQERPNVFVQAVSNLPPGVPIDVELHIVQPVDRIDGEWQLVVPLVVAPRFVRSDADLEGLQLASYAAPANGRDGVPDAGIREDGTGVRATIDAVVHAGLPIREMGSDTHPVAPEVDEADAAVVLEEVPLTRDFVLKWRTAGDLPAAAILAGGNHTLLMIEAPRTSKFTERVPREVVWVMDTSCSMTGQPLDIAKTAMREALATMDPRDSFTILGFGNEVSSLSKAPLPATADNVRRGLAFVARLHADGGTWMDKALAASLKMPLDPARRRTIVFVTDGQIGYETEILTEIAQRSAEATFVTLGIGSSPNRYLLDEMARLGGGMSAYADLASPAADEMDALVDAMDRPVLTGVKVDWGEQCHAHALAPVSIPDLRPGRPVIVLAKTDGGCAGTVRVTARGPRGIQTFDLIPEAVPHERAIASTWARERVADLERQWMRGEARDVTAAIREIGLSYSIVTSETSFLAIDERIVNPRGHADDVEQALDLPDGMEGEFEVLQGGTSEEITVEARRRAVDTESTSTGTVLTKEYLQRIPAGRTYQSAVQTVPGVGGGNPNMGGSASNENTYLIDGANITDPVTGTFSLNFNFDAIRRVEVAEQGRLPQNPGLSATANVDTVSGTNNLEARAEVGGLVNNPDGTGHVSGATSGPLVRDRMWFAGTADAQRTALGTLQTQRASAFGKITTQPSTEHRFSLAGAADPANVTDGETRATWGGAMGEGQWHWFPSGDENIVTTVIGGDRRLGSFDRSALGVSTVASALAKQDPLGGTHDLQVGAGLGGWQVASPDRTLAVRTLNAYVQDLARPQSNLSIGGGVRVDGVADELLASPRLFAAWDPIGDARSKLSGGYARYTSPDRYLPADLADRAVPVSDELFLNGEVEFLPDVVVRTTATWSRAAFAFAATPGLVPLPAAAVPTVEQRTTELAFGLRKVESRRWSADATFTLVPQLSPVDRSLLHDPTAAFVPGFLDDYRHYKLDLHAGWELPTDPFPLLLGGFARWGSAVSGADAGPPEWWLHEVLSLGASLTQQIPVRKGLVGLTGSVAWVENDATQPWIPLEAMVLVPGAPTIGEQPPLRVEAALSYAF